MTSKLKIQPQDKTPLQRAEYQLHPQQVKKLEEFAKSLDSDVSYVLGKIIEQVDIGTPQSAKRGRPSQSAQAPKKEAEKKSAAAVA